MKKCKQCGAVQNDKRSRCIDCGELLGKALEPNEEAEISANIEKTLDRMSERTEDFYVPLRDKIMSVLSILGIVAAVVILILVGRENQSIEASIPDDVIVQKGDGFISIVSTGETEYVYPSARKNTIDMAGSLAVLALIAFIGAVPMLLIPKFMWFIDTLKYRLFYGWDTTPSYFALVLRKAVTYLFFGCGVISVIYGYWLFF